MKQDYFERLKAICEKEGFCIIGNLDEDMVLVKRNDPWEGVEFVECIEEGKKVSKGRVYKVLRFLDWYNETGISIHDDTVSFVNMSEKHFKPSTETAYVEQLKNEAFERFGEIKEGDRFRLSKEGIIHELIGSGPVNFRYNKENDYLSVSVLNDDESGVAPFLYKQGKWAERMKYRLTGSFSYYSILRPSEEDGTIGFAFKGFTDKEGNLPIDDLDNAGQFLASQLEKYLNGEIE